MGERRDIQLLVYVSESEREDIDKLCKYHDRGISSMLRNLALDEAERLGIRDEKRLLLEEE